MTGMLIATLAILKVNSDRGADYIDNFVPFVGECLRASAFDVVSVSELQLALRDEFGIDIPQGPLRTILDRAVSRRLATRDARVYRRAVPRAAGPSDFAQVRARALREQAALVDRLEAFSEQALGAPWPIDLAEDTLLHYLAERGGSLLSGAPAQGPLGPPTSAAPNADYVLNSFVKHLSERDPEGFEYLTTAVKGSVLASVLYFDDLGSVNRKFDDLIVYLDTIVLLEALGRLGPAQQTASRELLDLALDLGAGLACFKDTLRELEGIHEFTVHCLRSRSGIRRELWGAAEYLVRSGRSASDVQLMAEHLERDLSDLGVTVKDRPPHSPSLTVDEVRLSACLRAAVRYRSDEPLQHDLDAITAIHRLRRGDVYDRLENAKAIFVTTNTAVARVAGAFFREHHGRQKCAPICMPDHQFATLAWLKKPLRAPDLPTKYVLADAFAGLNPPESIWRAYVAEINKLEANGGITTEDYYLLRYSPAALEALMGTTQGGGRPFIQGSVPEILARAQAAQRADAERQLRVEAERRSRAEQALVEHAEADEQERLSREQAHTAQVTALQASISTRELDAQRDREARLQRYLSMGAWTGRVIRYAILFVFLCFAIIQLYATVQPLGPLPPILPHSPLLLGVAVVIGVVGIILAVRGGSVASLFKPAESWIADLVSRRLVALFEPAGAPSDNSED